MTPGRWGDEAPRPLPASARGLVDVAFGVRDTPAADPDDRVAVPVPECRLSGGALEALAAAVGPDHLHTDRGTRLLRTRGRSTADLLRMRSGDAGDAPDAVVTPADHDEVVAVLAVCAEQRVAVVPFGGGTSVVGGLAPGDRGAGFAGVVALDLARLDRLVEVDAVSGLAVLEAGVRGPDAERLLAAHGLTLGHVPQSFEWATVGGFAATRSAGQASSGYGRFDDLVLGVVVATPRGTLDLGTAPASAAGPDLVQLVLGSEGAFGVVTRVRVRVRRRPAGVAYDGWRLPDLAHGLEALREVAQRRLQPAVLRLSDEAETAIDLADPDRVGGGAGGEAASTGGCLLVAGHEGDEAGITVARERLAAVLARHGGVPQGPGSAASWAAGRFRGPFLRDTLLDLGVLVETLETAAWWSRVPEVYAAVRTALERSLTTSAHAPVVLAHVSHVYETGASLYFTVAVRAADDPLAQWAAAKTAACDAIVASGGTITHHHAVGRDHAPWLAAEVGGLGVEVLRAVKSALDPVGVLNPGVLFSP